MNDNEYVRESMKWTRLLERQKYIYSWTPEEACAYVNLGPKEQRRYDLRCRRWIRGEIDGPMPLIPGTYRSTNPAGDVYYTDEYANLVS